MTKIIVGKKFIEGYCYHALSQNPWSIAVIFPKEEIKKYWDYAVSYGTNTDYNEYTIGTEKDKITHKHVVHNVYISEYDILCFYFPDDYPEEELFYFQLKYC